jgi:hypothetical protein
MGAASLKPRIPHFTKGDLRYFDSSDLEEAKAWQEKENYEQ